MGDKGAVGADLYIEDAPGNVEKLRRDGQQVIVFTNSTNRHLDGPRADTWDEIYEMVMRGARSAGIGGTVSGRDLLRACAGGAVHGNGRLPRRARLTAVCGSNRETRSTTPA